MKTIKDLNDIDTSTVEGKLLFASLSILTGQLHTDLTPWQVLEKLNYLANEIYDYELPGKYELETSFNKARNKWWAVVWELGEGCKKVIYNGQCTNDYYNTEPECIKGAKQQIL